MAILGTALGKLDYTDVVGSLKKMERYLRNLQEELEFRLANLDSENFNDTGLKEIGETITEPITVELEDTAGHVSTLEQTAEGLTSTVSKIQTDYAKKDDLSGYATTSQLEQTAQGFTLTVSGQQLTLGNSTVSNAGNTVELPETDLSNYTTTDDLTSALTGYASTSYVQSEIEQTVNGISLSVENGDEKSTLKLMSGTTELSSKDIQITGMVTFDDLKASDGTTVIDGGNITTGTIKAIEMTGNTISGGTISGTTISGSTYKSLLTASGNGGDIRMYYLFDDKGDTYLAGGLTVYQPSAGTYDVKLYTGTVLNTAFRLCLESTGNIKIAATGDVGITSGSDGHIWLDGRKVLKSTETSSSTI